MIYKCLICGHLHNEESTGVLLKDLDECPICKQDTSNFVEVEKTESSDHQELAYNKEFAKSAFGIGAPAPRKEGEPFSIMDLAMKP